MEKAQESQSPYQALSTSQQTLHYKKKTKDIDILVIITS
jgi:hypothetical protein